MSRVCDTVLTSDAKLQAIYNAEQNVELRWFWDSGVEIFLGDSINGYSEGAAFDTVKEAIDWAYERVMNKPQIVTSED